MERLKANNSQSSVHLVIDLPGSFEEQCSHVRLPPYLQSDFLLVTLVNATGLKHTQS